MGRNGEDYYVLITETGLLLQGKPECVCVWSALIKETVREIILMITYWTLFRFILV